MNPEETSEFKGQLSKGNTEYLQSKQHLEYHSMHSIESDSIYYSLEDSRLSQRSEEQSKNTIASVPDLEKTSSQLKSKRRGFFSYILKKIRTLSRKIKKSKTAVIESVNHPHMVQNVNPSTVTAKDRPRYFTRKLDLAKKVAKTANHSMSKQERAVASKARDRSMKV
ncbi:hypothetical protein [Candidatus Enterococcus mangumiae]|uniref:CHAP domain-containing protein n=1 Tax=Candidatus Enterococcus mangumiae TaxID=2230878 RepID=A0ABZ2SY14_9ENTE|nr:hypothetical protein [Enterococcus sp. DIV1094]MBO0488930.1 hypothetical protein [Enterococcus sp. DIV1094]